jgi:hypothetical protein
MSEKAAELRAAEARLIQMFGVQMRWCRRCKQKKHMAAGAWVCLECQQEHAAEANRKNQRRRRQREKRQRRQEAGIEMSKGFFKVELPIPCAHCGEPFLPARSTGRYCSTRCRVAAHRGAKRTR